MTTANVPARFSDPVRFILHPTDFAPQSELAFAHALRLALTNRARLTLLHVGDNSDEEWDRFPAVRQTLQRWGLLDEGAPRADVAKLGIEVEKIIVRQTNIVDVIANFATTRQIDLLIMATEQRHGLARWLERSTAEGAARKAAIPTLFVPAGGRGCVSLEDGRVTMDRVLIPVDHQPPVGEAIERGLRAIAAYSRGQSNLTLLHVGPESQFPDADVPDGPWRVIRTAREGDPVAEILAEAEASASDLLILVTKGTEGLFDVLRGTTTEQVLRRAPCPVLSIPANG